MTSTSGHIDATHSCFEYLGERYENANYYNFSVINPPILNGGIISIANCQTHAFPRRKQIVYLLHTVSH